MAIERRKVKNVTIHMIQLLIYSVLLACTYRICVRPCVYNVGVLIYPL